MSAFGGKADIAPNDSPHSPDLNSSSGPKLFRPKAALLQGD